MLQWRLDETSWAHLLPAESLDRVLKRLSMFVLRSKVTFSPSNESLCAIGLWGTAAEQLSSRSASELEGRSFAISMTSASDAAVAAVPACHLLMDTPCAALGLRGWLVGPSEAIHQIIAPLATAQELPEAAWLFSEIGSGKAWVGEKTQDIFVPQMVNFELIRGVSFTKGCYPGQEVVARSQYLGKLKRRTFRADLSGTEVQRLNIPISELPGQDVWSSVFPAEPCGRVVAAAPVFDTEGRSQAGAALLIELTLSAWDAGGLAIGSLNGPTLEAGHLPYGLADAA
jgi:folate-binding protein YgfZ